CKEMVIENYHFEKSRKDNNRNNCSGTQASLFSTASPSFHPPTALSWSPPPLLNMVAMFLIWLCH
ncbi:hypothetical protein NQZ68_019336, partial [Dissostichus eleginoides]